MIKNATNEPQSLALNKDQFVIFLSYLSKLCFFFQGPSAACAHENIKDWSSYDSMKEGGWDLKNIKEKERLVLPGQTCEAAIDLIEKHSWFVQQWAPSVISATFWGSGRVNLKFNNCNNQGEVTILVDGTEISKSKSVGVDSTAAFNVEEGTLVEIKVDNRGIIRLIDLQIECGKFIFQGMSTVLILNYAYKKF